MECHSAYAQAISSGLYDQSLRLKGKYDNVRRFWEDRVTAANLAPYLQKVSAQNGNEGVRVVDIGCGTGDGLQILQDISLSVRQEDDSCAGPKISYYKGIDNNSDMLHRAQKAYRECTNVEFISGDFCESFPVGESEKPFDLYFTSYGTLSHCSDEELVRLLAEIARHARPGSLIMGDWLGRYSYEWQDLWTYDEGRLPYIDYRISYHQENVEGGEGVQECVSFNLRLMSPRELKHLVGEAEKRAGVRLTIKRIFDRSLLVGRHMETGEYNADPQPIRREVNRLFHPGLTADMKKLTVDIRSREGFQRENRILQKLSMNWNALVEYTACLYEGKKGSEAVTHPSFSLADAEESAQEIRKKIKAAAPEKKDIRVRAEIVEPALARGLCCLEMGIQEGIGLGHGIAAILEVGK